MRNLALYAQSVIRLDAALSATAVDVDENILYATSESIDPNGDIRVELWKLPATHKGVDTPSSPFAIFTATAAPIASDARQIVSLRIVPETKQIAVITRAGDIALLSLETEFPTAEVEGTFESGILAAAWSPDDFLLALVTGEEKLILMTSTFNILSEALIETAEFGEDTPINVGWGSKQTQFHGSLGKVAAQAPAQNKFGSSPDDDELPRISWRGDVQYFVVSKLSPPFTDGLRRRVLRVYDRQGVLQSTSEALGGLEHTLSWRPSGNLIAGTQRFGFEGGGTGKRERHDVVFFERNGLRHGEFGLRVKDLDLKPMDETLPKRQWGYRVRELVWNADSDILAAWIEKEEGDLVQFWTTGNYHWYLKQEVSAPFDNGESRFTSVNWHPENPHLIILTTTSSIITRTYRWNIFASHTPPPIDSGSVAVFDGSSILLTPFRTQNVPPPMSSYQLSLDPQLSSIPMSCVPRTPVHASFSPEADYLSILWECGYIEYWNLKTRLGPGPEKIMDPVKTWTGTIDTDIHSWRQLLVRTLGEHLVFYVIGTRENTDIIATVHVEKDNVLNVRQRESPTRNGRLVCAHPILAIQDLKGDIYEFDNQTLEDIGMKDIGPETRFPEFCPQARIIPPRSNVYNGPPGSEERLYIGLSAFGKLLITRMGREPKVLAPNVTSFTFASGFVIYTTSAHESWFVPMNVLDAVFFATEEEFKNMTSTWETRKVERGSRIIVAVPSSMSLVLQMPRGNLETINPRPLVMEVVKQDLDACNYRKAFLACRKHRIDLTVLVTHDQKAFFDRVALFVKQVEEVDYINLFLTVIGRSSLPAETVTLVCDAVRKELEIISLKTYVNSILTAYVVKAPPDHESGLALLPRLRDEHPDLVEEAVKYIIFLVDVDVLFDTALGMYDFSLVLMIAQHSQKDPREYLPFLRELRALDKYYQQFRIDDHLKRREKALKNLSLAGPEHFHEATGYIEKYQLYESALSIWKKTKDYDTILGLYGDWLFDRREFRSAAVVFVEAQKLSKAMAAHERALEWRELFTIAFGLEMPEEKIVDIAYRVADELVSKKRHLEAGQVLLDYAKDIRQAVIAFVEGNGFSEARRIISMYSQPELVEHIVHPAAMGNREQISEDLREMREQLQKQVKRIRELRLIKIEEPDAFYGTEDPTLHNVDVMTDASMAVTTFTRYTAAPSTLSRTSKRSSRSKRKLERKIGSGRKGTVDEEEYLLKSITKLVGRFNATRDEAGNLLPHLFQLTSEHREEGRTLQVELSEFEDELGKALEEVWTKASGEEAPSGESWAARMEETEKMKTINPIDRVPKPDFPRGENWRIKLFELDQGY